MPPFRTSKTILPRWPTLNANLRLYHETRSTASQIVRTVLLARGLWAEDHGAGVPRDPSPAQPLPVLVDDGEIVAGLGRILRHLDRRFPKRIFRPKPGAAPAVEDPKASAWLDEAEEMAALSDALRRNGAQPHPSLIRLIKTRLDSALGETAWLSGRKFGAADLAWGVIVRRAELSGLSIREFPRLRRWLGRLRRRVKFERIVRPPSRRLAFPVSAFLRRRFKRKPQTA